MTIELIAETHPWVILRENGKLKTYVINKDGNGMHAFRAPKRKPFFKFKPMKPKPSKSIKIHWKKSKRTCRVCGRHIYGKDKRMAADRLDRHMKYDHLAYRRSTALSFCDIKEALR